MFFKVINQFLIGLFVVFAFLSKPVSISAQEFGIVAIINDEIMSAQDLENRIKLVFNNSNIPYTEEAIKKFESQIKNAMIDDILKIQEAQKLGIRIDMSDINNAIATIETNNKIKEGTFYKIIKDLDIPKETLHNQIKAEIAWLKIIQSEIMPNVIVRDDEINEIVERAKLSAGKTEVHISEIFLPVESMMREKEVLEVMEKMLEHIKMGTEFEVIAKQFSQSPAAMRGGDGGWILEEQLEKEIIKELAHLKIGSLSKPIRTLSGYYLIKLHGKRQASSPDEMQTVFELSQIFIPTDTSEIIHKSIIGHTANMTSCENFNKFAKEVGTPNSGSLGKVKAKEMPSAIYDMIKNFPIEKTTPIMPIKDGELIFMVCSKELPQGLPDIDMLRKKLEMERIDTMARRKIRELRRSAVIEIRR